MKYLLSLFLVISLNQAVAQHRDTTFKLNSYNKQISIRFKSIDTLILTQTTKENNLFFDSIFLSNGDTIGLLTDFLSRWGVNDTAKEYAAFVKYLQNQSLIDSSKSFTYHIIPLRQQKVNESLSTSKFSFWRDPIGFFSMGVLGGFLFFLLLQIFMKKIFRRRKLDISVNSDNRAKTSLAENKKKLSALIMLSADLHEQIKKRKIDIPDKPTINDVAQKLLSELSSFEKSQKAVQSSLESLKADNDANKIAKEELQEKLKNEQDKVSLLTVKFETVTKQAEQDEQVVSKAQEWVNRAVEDIHAHITNGNEGSANQQLFSSSLNSLLLLYSYLDYRRKLARSSNKDGISSSQKSIEFDPNLRILMGERLELKQPGSDVRDAPPLMGQLRELVKKQGLSELAPFGYAGYKIKL